MEKLTEIKWQIAKEYARQIRELFGVEKAHWIGTNDQNIGKIETLDVGEGYLLLSFADCQLLIDRLDEFVKMYGTREAVARHVADWQEWYLDANVSAETFDSHIYMSLLGYVRNPLISLEKWLLGQRKVQMSEDAQTTLRMNELRFKRDVVTKLTQEYRESRSLWNIIDNLTTDIKALEAKSKPSK